MSLTVEGVLIQALARVQEISKSAPAANSATAYRRIAIRQQELFAKADEVSDDYNGASATAALINGALDLATITDPVPVPEAISRIEIADAGTSGLPVGTEVAVVTQADSLYAAIPPRVTLRNRIIRQVGTDLFHVTSLAVFYARRPKMYCPEDGCDVTEIRSPYDELLVLDLSKYIMSKSRQVPQPVRAEAIGMWGSEEVELLGKYLRHVADYAPVASRFNRPPKGLALPIGIAAPNPTGTGA